MTDSQVDIKENDIFELSPELLTVLLKDHTLSTPERQVNIFLATDNYADRGAGYQYADEITVEKITVIAQMQDFSESNGKVRSKSVAEIDQQLYAKYKLSCKEIAFIESIIKPI